MKRILTLILTMVMLLTTFTSCAVDSQDEAQMLNGLQTEESGDNQTEIIEDSNIENLESCAHVDASKDHTCDKCGSNVGRHADSANDGNHKCDYCKKTIGKCVDLNSDGKCEECGASIKVGEIISNKNYTRNGKNITFGSYPQTEVTDSSLISTLNSKAGTLPTSENPQAWTDYDYWDFKYEDGLSSSGIAISIPHRIESFMWYIDIEHGGEKYRGVYFISNRPACASGDTVSYQDDNGYTTKTVYWFKYEPISWTILSENKTDRTALILCDMIIDAREFDFDYNGTYISYSNNYAESTIRKWMNETFYNIAFNELQKQIILTTTVDNSKCEDTQDKIFLLSKQDVNNSDYGFSSSISGRKDRRKKPTDYALAQGVVVRNGEFSGWLLRSPYEDEDSRVNDVSEDGSILMPPVVYTCYGFAPALQIKL